MPELNFSLLGAPQLFCDAVPVSVDMRKAIVLLAEAERVRYVRHGVDPWRCRRHVRVRGEPSRVSRRQPLGRLTRTMLS